jgi:UDP-2,3-diacylglucosamine hydrolase
MKTLFISDIHLDGPDSMLMRTLSAFLHTEAVGASALYILGDLFESYVGDDENNQLHRDLARLLSQLAQQGTKIYLLNGNRDFLVGKQFTTRCHAILLEEPVVIDLYGTPTLLLHGDSLCTLDKPYQRMRTLFRNKLFQSFVLQLPLSWRLKAASLMRDNSKRMLSGKSDFIMDVTQEAVEQILIKQRVNRLIHGHTHRPAIHHFTFNNNQQGERIVLGAWDATAQYLEATPQTTALKTFVMP